MSGLYESTCNYMKKHHMLPEDGKIVAAVSGGADSMCLLHLLSRMRSSWGLEIFCVHVHHGLRGEEADRDARFVSEICGQWEIPCKTVRLDVAGYAGSHGMSLEEAGRFLRYRVLVEQADLSGAAYIAVAHHRDDDAETVLHHLIRGSGLKGLSGIRPVRQRIVRPLLHAGRADILEYLQLEGIPHCEDSTNRDQDFTRNRIRGQLIPLLEELNPKAVENILKASELIARADEYLDAQAEALLLRWEQEDALRETLPETSRGACAGDIPGSVRIPADDFLAQAPVLRTYVVKQLLARVAGSAKDITSRHIEAVAGLAAKEVGRELDLPYGLKAKKGYDCLWVGSAGGSGERPGDGEPKDLCGEARGCFAPGKIRIFDYQKGMEFPKNEYTKWFDYGRIKDMPIWRHRQTGDYICIKGGGHKRVKDYMIDEKIPREERGRILLLADGSHIIWIVGYRISEYYKVTGQTIRVLEASV